MAASGGKRFDYGPEFGFKKGEARTFRIVVEDENGDELASFSGWSVGKLYILDDAEAYDGPDELTGNADVEKSADVTTAPNFDVAMAGSDWPAAGRWWDYEAWREDAVAGQSPSCIQWGRVWVGH